MALLIVIPNPPTYIESGTDKKTGRPRRRYLTAQLFYSGINPFLRKKIVENMKWFLLPYLRNVPVMRPRLRIDFTMRNMSKGTQDPDNLFFWGKLTLDLLKGKSIPDDSKKYIRRVSYGFEDGPPALEILIEEGR